MSSHETIRVLEVEVDAAVPSPETPVKTESGAEEGRGKALEPVEGAVQDRKTASSTIPAGGVTITHMHILFHFILGCSGYSPSVFNISHVNLYSF